MHNQLQWSIPLLLGIEYAGSPHGRDPPRPCHQSVLRRRRRRGRHQPRDPRRPVHRARRPVRLRQVDPAADDRRSRGGDTGHGVDRWTGRNGARTPPPRHRHGLPELRALSAHDGPSEPRLRPQGAADVEAGDRQARRRGREAARARRAPRSAAGTAVGWPAPASRDGPAIVREPQAFLMDEPLSNLDAKLRVGMRASLSQLHVDSA